MVEVTMEFLSKYKTYLLVALGVIAVLGLWWAFSQGPSSNSLVKTEGEGTNQVEKGLVDTLLQLRAVSLSGTIFSDPAFTNLRDFGTQIIAEPVGRTNPFAPVTIVATSSPKNTPRGNSVFPPRRR